MGTGRRVGGDQIQQLSNHVHVGHDSDDASPGVDHRQGADRFMGEAVRTVRPRIVAEDGAERVILLQDP